jgi:hypothetical protein
VARRRLSLGEFAAAMMAAGEIRKTIDPDLADLLERAALGDDSALTPALDRLRELGRDSQADRLARLLGGN